MPTLTPRRGLPAILAALLVFLLAPAAHAGVELEVSSILGASGPSSGELLVQVRNPERRERRGTIAVEERTGRVHARTPFAVGPGATSIVKLVAAPSDGNAVTVARDEAGEEIGHTGRPSRDGGGFVLFEIPPQDTTLLPFHVDAAASLALRRTGGGAVVTAALTDPTTGAIILPDRPSSYAHAALVLVPARRLDTLDAAARDVLLAWVKGGGSLAIGVRDPFDLGRPALTSLVGSGVRTAPYVAWAPEAPQEEEHVGPTLSPAVAAQLTGYAGDRLQPSRFGAVAQVGLGNVYLLAIDPWSQAANGDRWVQAQIVELVDAEEPRAMIASTSRDDGFYVAPIVRVLDANEASRPTLAIATLLLALYAIGVGPVVFRRLAKRGPALAPYRWTLVASAGMLAILVVLGVFAKGGFGSRSRQLALVEVASGETVAIERSFRSFYTSRERVLDVAASAPRSTFGDPTGRGAILATTATGESTLEHVAVRPWETVVVREDATIALGQGITIASDGDELVVTNRSGAGLRDALVTSPVLGCLGFGAIADGAVVRSSVAKRLDPARCEEGPNRAPAWTAIRSAFAGRSVQGSSHRAVLVGELDRPAAATTAGFRVDRHTVLVRVVGGAS